MSRNEMENEVNVEMINNSNPSVRIYVEETRARRTQNGIQRFMTVRAVNTVTLDVDLITYANPIVRVCKLLTQLTVARERFPKNIHRNSRFMMKKIKFKRSRTG